MIKNVTAASINHDPTLPTLYTTLFSLLYSMRMYKFAAIVAIAPGIQMAYRLHRFRRRVGSGPSPLVSADFVNSVI